MIKLVITLMIMIIYDNDNDNYNDTYNDNDINIKTYINIDNYLFNLYLIYILF